MAVDWSDISNIQVISPDWQYIKLANFSLSNKNSFVNGPFGSDLLSTELFYDGFPVVYIRDIKYGRYKRISKAYVKKEKYQSLTACQVHYGDVIITKVGDPPCEAAVYECGNPGIVTQDVIRIKTGSFYSSLFIKYLLNSDIGRRQVRKIKIAGTRERVSLTDFKKLKFPYPSQDQQKKIAKILSTWDKAIATTEQLLVNSEQQKKALIQKLLTGKKRLPGFEGEWVPVKLKELLIKEKEKNRGNKIDRVLSVSNKYGFILPDAQFSKKVASDNLTNYKVVRKGQFGYNPSRINVGSIARLDSYEVGVLSPMYVVFSIDQNRLNSDYFLSWLRSNEASQRISSSTQGSVRDSVGFDALCTFPFRLPPLQEQDAIANVIATCDSLIAEYQASLNFLRNEKKALMQQLLTGKRRVKIDEADRLPA